MSLKELSHFRAWYSVVKGTVSFQAGLGIHSSVFWANHLCFAKKWANERFAQNDKQFTHSLIFGEQPKQFAHGRSFLVSDLSESLKVAHFWWVTWTIRSHRSFLLSDLNDPLTSLTKNEGMSKSLIFLNKKTYIKHNKILDFLAKCFWANRSFTHLSWVTWANCSWSLICHERHEGFAHSRSFVLSNLSDSLTVAHLSWVIWANHSQPLIWFERNEWLSKWAMSEFPALISGPDILSLLESTHFRAWYSVLKRTVLFQGLIFCP